jgi:hypothetical protein
MSPSTRFISSSACVLSHRLSALKCFCLDNIYVQDTMHHKCPDNCEKYLNNIPMECSCLIFVIKAKLIT